MARPSAREFRKILVLIFRELSWMDLVNVAEVCRSWRAVAQGARCQREIRRHLKWLDDERHSFDPYYADRQKVADKRLQRLKT